MDTSYATPTDLQLQQIKDLSAGIVLPGKETVAKILGRNVTNPYVIVSSALQNFSAGWMSNAFTALMSVNKFLTTNFSVDQSQFQQQIFNLQQLVNDSAMAFPQQLQNLTVGNFNGNSFLQSLDCFASALRIYPFLPQNSTKSLIKISTNLSEWLKGFQSYFPSQNASMTNMTQTRSFPSSNSLTILTPGISGNFTPPLISQISPTIVTILIVLGILFSKV